ncbi:MAG: hypothetical protein NT019_01390 [Candidatus Adlerbacteria bacterium]|nr:hypothetical protein [Candidatus Adlerbacteria bacterium]
MEENSTKTQIEERLAELPQEVRDAVLSADMGTHIRAIGQKHGLHIDQVGKLEDETMLVMLGFFDPDTFNQQIAEQLAIPAADAAVIAGEISAEVFAPIREALKHFTDTKKIQAIPEEPRTSLPMVTTAPALPTIIPATAAPLDGPSAPTPTPVIPAISMPTAEKMLTEKTVATAAPRPIYKTDPYREPVE